VFIILSLPLFSTKRLIDEYGNTLLFEMVPSSLRELRAPLATLFWRSQVRVRVRKQPNSDATPKLLNIKEFYLVFSLVEQHRDNLVDQIRALDNSAGTATTTVSAAANNNDNDNDDDNDNIDGTKECVICFERKPDVVLPCGHPFCSQCLADWNARQHSCPMCRNDETSDTDAWLLTTKPSRQELFEFFQSFIETAQRQAAEQR